MSRNPPMPFTLIQVQRWRVTRVIEMVQRKYKEEEIVAELQGWLASGIERIPPTFNLADAATRAIYARTADGDGLKAILPCDELGRPSGPSRDIIETAIYAAMAPHIPQLEVEPESLRSYQPDLGLVVNPQNPVSAGAGGVETLITHEGVAHVGSDD